MATRYGSELHAWSLHTGELLRHHVVGAKGSRLTGAALDGRGVVALDEYGAIAVGYLDDGRAGVAVVPVVQHTVALEADQVTSEATIGLDTERE